jgi:hypothetical protein
VRDAWIDATGQRWKLRLFIAGTGTMMGSFAAFIVAVKLESHWQLLFALLMILSGAASLAWLALSIRCARCRRRPAWWLMTTVAAGIWLS